MANSQKAKTDINRNQKGFNVVELLIIIVVVGLIGSVGFMVYNNHNKKQATNSVATTTTTKPVVAETKPTTDPYAGWKSYCGDSGVCFKYPSDWNPVTTGPAGPEPGNFINPQHTLKLVSDKYDSNSTLTDPTLWYTSKLESLSTANDKYKVWGGYLSATGVYVPQYAVVDASKVGGSGLVVEQTKSTTDDTYTSYTINNGSQHYSLNVFALSKDGFNKSKADAWFSSDDAKTALLIVQSLYFK